MPYWSSPLESYVDQYFLITWPGLLVLFVIGVFVTTAFGSPAMSNAVKLRIFTTAHVVLTLGYSFLCLFSLYYYSFKVMGFQKRIKYLINLISMLTVITYYAFWIQRLREVRRL